MELFLGEKAVDIKGYEWQYAITTFGRLWCYPNKGRKGKWFSLNRTTRYIRVALVKDGKRMYFHLHRLVAEAFIPNPENKRQVNHINGARYDCRVTNLEWVIAKKLRIIEPLYFEVVCKRILEKLGAAAENTQKTYDGGVDFYALDMMTYSANYPLPKTAALTVIGQAKRYAEKNDITETEIRKFVGGAILKLDELRKQGKVNVLSPVVFAFWTTSELHMGDVQIGTINSDTVRDLILKLQARGNKPATVNRFLEILKTILRYKKQEWDFIHLNKQQKGRIRVISREEEGRAIDLLRNTKHNSRRLFYPEVADLVEVLVDTGMRLSEALKLKYEDVNFETNLISIWINKGGRPRSIPMTQRVRRIMEARQGINKHKPFSLTNDQAGTAWAWVRKEMNLKNDREFVLHALRHTTASRLLNKGCDLVTIRDWLGHADIQTTMRYAHLAPNKLAQAAAILDSFSSAD